MYDKIYNVKTGNWVKTKGKVGKHILIQMIHYLKESKVGGATKIPVSELKSSQLCSECIESKCEKCGVPVKIGDSVSLSEYDDEEKDSVFLSDTLLCVECATSTLTNDMLQEITVNCDLMMSEIIESATIKWEEKMPFTVVKMGVNTIYGGFLEEESFKDRKTSLYDDWTISDDIDVPGYKLNFKSIKKVILSVPVNAVVCRPGSNFYHATPKDAEKAHASRHWENNELFIVEKTYVVVKRYVMNLINNLNNSKDDDVKELISKKIIAISRWMLRSFYRFEIYNEKSARADNFFQYSLVFAKEKINRGDQFDDVTPPWVVYKDWPIPSIEPLAVKLNKKYGHNLEQALRESGVDYVLDDMYRQILDFQAVEINPATIEKDKLIYDATIYNNGHRGNSGLYQYGTKPILLDTAIYRQGLAYSTQTFFKQHDYTLGRYKKCNGIPILTKKEQILNESKKSNFIMNENITINPLLSPAIPYNIRWGLGDNELNELLTGGLPAMKLQYDVTLFQMNSPQIPKEKEKDENLLVKYKREQNSSFCYKSYMRMQLVQHATQYQTGVGGWGDEWHQIDLIKLIISKVRALWKPGTYLEKGRCGDYNKVACTGLPWILHHRKECEWIDSVGCRQIGKKGTHWIGERDTKRSNNWIGNDVPTQKANQWIGRSMVRTTYDLKPLTLMTNRTPFVENNEIGRKYIQDLIMYHLSTLAGIVHSGHREAINTLRERQGSHALAVKWSKLEPEKSRDTKIGRKLVEKIREENGSELDFQSQIAIVFIERENFWLYNETIFNAINRIYPPKPSFRGDDGVYEHIRYRPLNELTDGSDYVPNDALMRSSWDINSGVYPYKNNFLQDCYICNPIIIHTDPDRCRVVCGNENVK